MSTTTYTQRLCDHCRRPMLSYVMNASGTYHPECVQSPYHAPAAPSLTAEQVRQIVREELARQKAQP